MKKYNFLLAIALIIGITSCKKQSAIDGIDAQGTKEVVLKISKGISTYAEENPLATDGTNAVTFGSGHIYFVDASGQITNHFEILASGTPTDGQVALSDLTTGTTFENIRSTASEVYVIGNVPSGTNLPNAGLFSSVQETVVGVSSQSDASNATLYGTDDITGTDPNYEAEVEVKPLIARIELAGMTAEGSINEYEVTGIYVDNFFTQASIDGTTNAGFLKVPVDDASSYGPGQYSSFPSLHDYNEITGGPLGVFTPVDKVTKPADDKVWAYNIFAGNAVPRLIIRLENVELSSGTMPTPPVFLTVTGFNASGTPLTAMDPGKVYRIAADALKFDETDLTTTPNLSSKDVDVTLTIMPWEGVDVTPEL